MGGKDKARIATYNVHLWADPFFKFKTAEISSELAAICKDLTLSPKTKVTPVFDVIRKLNADILILQEAASDNLAEFQDYKKILMALGYEHGVEHFGNMNKDRQVPYGPVGNWILSKYPLIKAPEVFYFKDQMQPKKADDYVDRCCVHAQIKLPNNQLISVYGTHLDVFDHTEKTRLGQIKQLVEIMTKDSSENILFAGDLNSEREQDYQTMSGLWDMIMQENQKRNEMILMLVLNYLKVHNFVDCFSLQKQATPGFTTWSGTTIDFMMPLITHWNLSIDDCGVYYDAASDHLPVFMDIILKKGSPRRQAKLLRK